jgi:hypothetical protein
LGCRPHFTGVDGIIGFGPVDLAEGTVSGEDEVLTEALGVYLTPESGSDTSDTNGELTLGGTDSARSRTPDHHLG